MSELGPGPEPPAARDDRIPHLDLRDRIRLDHNVPPLTPLGKRLEAELSARLKARQVATQRGIAQEPTPWVGPVLLRIILFGILILLGVMLSGSVVLIGGVSVLIVGACVVTVGIANARR